MVPEQPILELLDLTKSYGGKAAVANVSISIETGDFLSIIGPSGCGKSTILKMIIGAVRPTSGRVLLRGKDLSTLRQEALGVVMVWQSLALFPHMSVAENIGFGLAMRNVPTGAIRSQVERCLDMVDLPGLGERRIGQLSGGEQQRVALARALVLEPDILLLDEPLSGLDKDRRGQMLAKFREIHRTTGATIVMVTHEQAEAMTTSSRVAVMSGGRIVQSGSPEDVALRPLSAFVARFVGHKNVFAAKVTDINGADVTVATPAGLFHACRPRWTAPDLTVGGAVTYVVDAFRLSVGQGDENRVTGALDARSVNGGNEIIEVIVPGLGSVRCERPFADNPSPQGEIPLSWRAQDAYVLPPELL